MGAITGIISEVNNRGRGKGSNIVVNGTKYGCFDPVEAGIDTCNAGDEVTFDTSQNGQYINIVKGSLSKTGNTGVVAPPASSGGSPRSKGGGGYAAKVFPIPSLDGQRSIIRQNSLTHATSIVNNYCSAVDQEMSLDERRDQVLRLAADFEYFSAGDDVAAAAEEAMKQMGSTAQ
jgi:hypothetical protein